jgi:hypothetical protein
VCSHKAGRYEEHCYVRLRLGMGLAWALQLLVKAYFPLKSFLGLSLNFSICIN